MSVTSARAEQAETEAAAASTEIGSEGSGQAEGGHEPSPGGEGEAGADAAAPAPSGPSAEELGQRLNGAVQALQQARAQTRELRQQLARARSSQGQEPAHGLEIPDPSEDPIATLNAIRQLALQQQYEAETAEQQRQQAEAQRVYVGTLQEEARMDEAVFRTAHPDYDEALHFLAGMRRNELAMLGFSEAEVGQAIGMEALQLIDTALARGASPAKVAYEFARSRGYRGPGGQGSALHAIQQGQAASRTLSGAGGRPPASDAAPEERLSGLNGAALRDAWRRIKAERNGA